MSATEISAGAIAAIAVVSVLAFVAVIIIVILCIVIFMAKKEKKAHPELTWPQSATRVILRVSHHC